MNLETIIGQYGYIAIVIGTFFEGEIILILSGFLAHRGYFPLPLVIISAFIGTLLGDQFYFFIGRKKGISFLEKRPHLKIKIKKFQKLLEKYNLPVILGFRFLYGLRTAAPFVIGLSEIPFLKFFILNGISAAAWAAGIGLLGYFSGRGVEIILDDIKKYELWVLAAGIIFVLIRIFISYRRKRKWPADDL